MNFPTRIGTASVAAVAVIGLAAPASAPADVRFGSPLASSASDPGIAAQTPAVAGNAAGVVAAAYAQQVGGVNHIFARVKPAGVAAFGAAQSLNAASSSAPAAIVAADGTITVAWQQANACAGSSVFVATAPPGGTFGAGVKVSDNAFTPHLAVAPDGTVMVLYTRDKGSCIHETHVQVRPRVGSSADSVISDPGFGSISADDASIGIDAYGTAIAAFTQSLQVAPFTQVLRVARRPAGGQWTGTTLTGPKTSGSALAVASDGHAVVADQKAAQNNGYALEVRSLAPGASVFGAPQTVTDTLINEPLEGIAITNGGAAAVTTSSGHAATRANGASAFGTAAAVGLGASASSLVPAFTAEGELALFNEEKLPGSQRFSLVARVQSPGGALGPPQPTGLDSDATGTAVLAPFGTNDIVAGWNPRPAGAATFQAGLALGDGTPPALGAVSAPAGGLAGAPLAFGSAPTDDLGVAGVDWTFGDGATAPGAAVTHAFAAAGASTWSVTARDLVGNTANAAGGLTIQARPQPQPAKLAVKIAKPRRGTRARKLRSLGGTASGPVSRVEVSVVGVLRAKTKSARARCTSLGTAGRLAKKTSRASRIGCLPGRFLKAGGTKRWTLRLRHRLPRGTYVVYARARSATGAKSMVARVRYTLRA